MRPILFSVCIAVLSAGMLPGCEASRPRPAASHAGRLQSEISASADLADVTEILDSYANDGRTLLVVDIDDTLLTSAGFFGSDRWYEWQRTLAPGSPGYVPCRFDVIAMNYESGTQIPTQPTATALINSIRTDKIILTSRSSRYRSGTTRELRHAGYELPRPLSPAMDSITYAWQEDPATPPALVSYRDGIFMVSGQNKGLLLLDLLRRLGIAYERVVLVDDSERNINAVRDALASAGIAYRGIRYTRVVKTFDAKDIEAGIAGWNAWQEFLARMYPERLQRLKANECDY